LGDDNKKGNGQGSGNSRSPFDFAQGRLFGDDNEKGNGIDNCNGSGNGESEEGAPD
jgi:hypothetical protein